MKDYILSDKICIDCVENNYDSESEGVYYTGFNFFVDSKETNVMLPYIQEVLSSYNVPVVSISLDRKIQVPKSIVSSKEDIDNEIYSCSDYMINVSKKDLKKLKFHK